MHASFVNVDFVWRGVCHGLMRCQWFLLLELKWRAIDFATAPAPSYSKSALWQLLCKCRCQDAEARIEGPVTARDRDTWAETETAAMLRCRDARDCSLIKRVYWLRTRVLLSLDYFAKINSWQVGTGPSLCLPCSSESPFATLSLHLFLSFSLQLSLQLAIFSTVAASSMDSFKVI